MIRCRNNKQLTYLGTGDILFADEERDRWLFIDSMLTSLNKYIGNGKVYGWDVTDSGGLVVAVSARKM